MNKDIFIEKAEKPFDIVVVYNTFNEQEISNIWKELEFLTNESVLMPPEKTASAEREDGSLKKQNSAVFLHNIYRERDVSYIAKYSQELIKNDRIKIAMYETNHAHMMYQQINTSGVLISYYENSDFYESHRDMSAYTTLTYFFKEPKRFVGGDISFIVGDKKMTIEIENNLSVIFPSFYEHEVSKISMESPEKFSTLGRYCVSQFCGISLE